MTRLTPSISVIIPCHNNSDFLELVLFALRMQSQQPDEIICIDDACDEREAKLIEYLCRAYSAKMLQLPKINSGIGRRSHARNYGTDLARGNICLYLDGDMVVGPDYIKSIRMLHSIDQNIMIKGLRFSLSKTEQSKGLEHCWAIISQNRMKDLVESDIYRTTDIFRVSNAHDPTIGFIAASILPVLATNYKTRKFTRRQLLGMAGLLAFGTFSSSPVAKMVPYMEYSTRWDFCASNNLSVRKSHVMKIGKWDEAFTGWGEEDIDFAYRLYVSGITPVIPTEGTIYAYHLDHDVERELNRFTLGENARYFVRKYPAMQEFRKDVYLNYDIIL